MAFCRIVVPLLVISVVQCYAVQVPVFLWGALSKPGLKSNPLKTVPAEDFRVLLKDELVQEPFTVVFIEETLSVEDFSHKNAEGESSFPYLHNNIVDALYLPSVEHPLRVLNKLADPEQVNHVKLTENGLSADIESENDKFLFINLKDAREGESRAELLLRHNNFMESIVEKLQKRYDQVAAVYTGHYPSWTIAQTHSRVRRDTSTNNIDGLKIHVKNIYVDNVELGQMSSSATTVNDTEQQTTLVFGERKLTLNFYTKAGYWFWSTLNLEQGTESEELHASSEIFAITGFSYGCGQNVTFRSVNSTKTQAITFTQIRIQPYFTSNSSDFTFGDTFNCVGFFSVPIWAGLFVTFLMLAITFYGIMMMLDIRTMDRFDDPKGKTITINASE